MVELVAKQWQTEARRYTVFVDRVSSRWHILEIFPGETEGYRD